MDSWHDVLNYKTQNLRTCLDSFQLCLYQQHVTLDDPSQMTLYLIIDMWTLLDFFKIFDEKKKKALSVIS